MLTVGSLFSGIGGLELGLERAGMSTIWQSEIDPFASRVLAKHWPDVPNLGDITQIDWSDVERPDLICGGYPCQPFSVAGKRKGQADERHLWPFFRDALRHLRPRWAVLENVPGHLSLGFGSVLGDLSSLGYDAEWSIVSARDVGAPHIRERVAVIARSRSDAGQVDVQLGRGPGELVSPPRGAQGGGEGSGSPPSRVVQDYGVWGPYAAAFRTWAHTTGREPPFPVEPDGSPNAEIAGWLMGFPKGWCLPVTGKRAAGLYGNAVVPQVSELVGRRITC